jgi:hypothetical protein
VQDAGTATTDAGVQQSADTQATKAGEGQDSQQTTQNADGAGKPGESKDAAVDYKFDVPEGVTLDEGDLKQFTEIAKELKLPQDQASKLVGLAIAREQARAEAFVKQVQTWADEVKADKELGTDESIATAKKAIDLGPPELKELLNSTGLGNHPVVVRWALSVGKALSEDKFIAGKDGGNAQPKTLEERLYGKP